MTSPTPYAVSVVIATASREATLPQTLRSLAAQTRRPEEVVVVDGAEPPGVESLVGTLSEELGLPCRYLRTQPPSAAQQRNRGVEASSGTIVLFLDDDAYPESNCLAGMLRVFETDVEGRIGGVGVLITNQPSQAPSPRAKIWFDFLADDVLPSYSGKVIGPAVAVGAEPSDAHDVVDVDWLNSGCTAYRKTALPDGGFDRRFYGYSFMEDVDLSVRVARGHRLVVHRGLFMYHDSQPSTFKAPYARAKMIVENRYHVMTRTLGRRSLRHHAKFLASLAFPIVISMKDLRSAQELYNWLLTIAGTLHGLATISGFTR